MLVVYLLYSYYLDIKQGYPCYPGCESSQEHVRCGKGNRFPVLVKIKPPEFKNTWEIISNEIFLISCFPGKKTTAFFFLVCIFV